MTPISTSRFMGEIVAQELGRNYVGHGIIIFEANL